MKVVFTALLFLMGFVSSPAMAGPAPKVEVCHIPPGNPDNYHTITVSENALTAHLAHGDISGACNALCDTLCDDGNACTVDHHDDCEQNGCLASPEPVDCDDGNACTVDSCDPGSGCSNVPITCTAPDLCTNSSCNPSSGQCEESPVVCPVDYTCNASTGECDPDQYECQVDDDCSEGYTCIENECIEGAARNLRGPDTGSCDGPLVGYTSVVVLESDAGLQVDVEFTNGPANSSFTVYWVCTTAPGGCHGEACFYEDLGTITTDGSGNGTFSTVLPGGNPFPGQYVHFDVLGNENYTSITHDEIFPAVSTLSSSSSSDSAGGTGDPTDN